MNLLSGIVGKLLDRKSRLRLRKTAVASPSGLLRDLRLEALEQRQLLSVSIPLLNSDLESQTWRTNDNVNWYQAAVQAGTQAPNYNELDPRFGTPGFGKTAIVVDSAGNVGPNGEGVYGERNDFGNNQFFNYVSGSLPAPANGTNFFCIQPSSPSFTPGSDANWSHAWSWYSTDGQSSDVGALKYNYVSGTCELGSMYNVFIDQQPAQTTDAGNHADLSYPPMIPATTAIAGHTYQVTVALGNPLWNATNGNSNFPAVELEFTTSGGTYNEPSGTNSLTTSPQSGDTWLMYNGYGITAAETWANGSSDSNWKIAPGTFKDLTLTWTCPQQDNGLPLNIQMNFTGFTQTPGTSLPNMVCFDNIRLVDTTAAPTAPAAPSNLAAAGASASQINLSWTDNSNSETGFKIDQATSSDFTQNLTTVTVAANTTFYGVAGLSANTTYYYRARATNAVGDSANTATASATTGTAGTPVAVPIPDGNFTDATGYYLDSSGANGGGSTFTQPMTATLSGWSLKATPSTANGGYYSGGGWNPFGVLDSVSSGSASPYNNNAPSLGNQPGSSYNAFVYYPGEQYAYNGVVGGAQPGASLTMTTTGINLAAVAGSTYTATIQYANASWSNCNVNPSANVALNILANGIVVGTGTLSGLAQGAAWTTVTASWVAAGAYSGQAIQLQVVANNFLEGPGSTQQWEVPMFAFAHATLTSTTPAGLPTPPSGLTATAVSLSQINLSWTDNSNNETGFRIDQATSSDFSTGLTTVTVAANATTYSATGLASGTTYYYRVRATNANGDSVNTATASASTQGTIPAAPSGLTATTVSSSQINLGWTDNSNNETGFKIDQATSSDFSTGLTTVTVTANTTTYSATGLAAGTTYYYRVRATNAIGDSANTATASASTAATSVIPIPDASFEQAALGTYTNVPSGGTATLTSPVTGSIPGWNLSYTPTTYSGGTYLGWVPYFQVFPSSTYPNPGVNRSQYDEMESEDGSQHLSLFGGELFNTYPQYFGWQPYGIIPGQTATVSSAQSLATTVAGATYTATIAVADPMWHCADQNWTEAQMEAWYPPVPVHTPNFELDIVVGGQVVKSNTLVSPTAGQWYDLTTTWTATTSGQSLTLQAIASNFSEGQMGPGHTGLDEGPFQWTTSDASFDNARLTVTAAPASIPAAPSGLTATAVSSSQINLSWTDNSNNETGFKIDQATSSNFSTGLTTATVGANTTTYSATGLSASSTYYYRVRSTNATGDSANTSAASATTNAPGTPVAVLVPDGDFTDTAGFDINTNNGSHGPFVGPMTATLSGWTVSANPSTDYSGVYGGWNPYGGVDNTVTNYPASTGFSTNYSGSMPAGATNMFFYYPGEQITGNIGSRVAQTGDGLTLTTTGINATAISGTTYTASIYYANLTNNGNNNGPNVTLNILAGGVIVGTGSVTGLAPGSPWTQVTATWTASLHIGAAIQLQVVANNFLEGTQPWAVPNFGLTHATLTATAGAAQPVTVTNVMVGNTSWTSGSLAGGYSIPVGGGAQLLPLPEANINQIKVTFNENVVVDQSDLLLTGVNVPSYNVSGGTFSYNSSTFTATWTLPQSIGIDKLMLALNANGSDPIHDASGNRLDGEWTNPSSATQSSSNAYPSGDGTAGGNFAFRFNVLPGDANHDSAVNVGDLAALSAHWQQTGQGTAQGDFNGDGQVNVSDLAALSSNWQGALPSAEPTAGLFAAGAPAAMLSAPSTSVPLMVDAATVPQGSPQLLADAQLTPIVAEAERRWAAASGVNVSTAMAGASAEVADLPAGVLSETVGETVLIGRDAAGYGWFVDATPATDEEFTSSGVSGQLTAVDPQAVDRIDLLTVVEHELGHVLGLDDLAAASNDVMSSVLGAGVRRNASPTDAVLASATGS